MEDGKKISWLSLFIRIIIIFTLVLIITWLVVKVVSRNKLSDAFKNSINNMETVSVNYFKTVDLPLEKGKSIKITLEELISKELITSNFKDIKCDVKKSYAKIIRKKDSYEVETNLECGKEKNTITRKFSLKDCMNCQKKEDKPIQNDKENNNANKTLYYEYVKESISYSKWMKGNKEASNIENKYEYYAIDEMTYYSVALIDKKNIKNNKASYTLVLDKVPNNNYYFMSVNDSSYFEKGELQKYLDEKNISIKNIDMNKNVNMVNYSLDGDNYTYKLYPYYHDGKFYVNVKIGIKSLDKVDSYNNGYYIPIKITVRFNSDKILTTVPDGKYETISYYRYKETNREVVWSNKEYLEGYTKTGNTKYE